ncbi:hypothetical protein IJE86_02585 [bacterium]|nr:hypothetical protein [bacterium]
MMENKLPEGVGKKIVEALKKQSEIEIQTLPEPEMEEQNLEDLISEEPEAIFEEEPIVQPQIEEQETFSYQIPPVQPTPQQRPYIAEPVYHEPIQQNYFEPEIPYSMPQQPQYREPQPSINYDYSDNVYTEQTQPTYPRAKEFTIPSNVAVLKRLIAQLPQGVSKQTGAQIIRQTMEALGISMSTVLTEAQNFQDGLNTSARECVSTIQEYKNNIKNLEKQVSDYQKQSAQVNDLISLFIMTDK